MSLNTTNLKPAYVRRESTGRKHGPVKFTACLRVLAGLMMGPPISFAYVGPGAGITAIGALWALIATVVITLGGLLLWPVRALMKRKKGAAAQTEEASPGKTVETDIE